MALLRIVSIGCSAPPQDDERQQQKSAQTTASSARVGIVEQDRMRLETCPHVDTGQSARRRRWLSFPSLMPSIPNLHVIVFISFACF
uniref:Uncharacterized protein n=1 Tax=Acanthochromis polyacanthus TaxID=80966 RepID=A0A3Q1FTD0_9TELE